MIDPRRLLPPVRTLAALAAVCHVSTAEMLAQPNPLPVPANETASKGTAFTFAQPWNASTDPGFRLGDARLSWTPAALHVEAHLTDDDVISRTTGDNQKSWELGDVFEIFVQIEGHPGYAELHVTPNQHRVQLDLPGPRGRPTPEAAPLAFDKMLVTPVRFDGKATRTTTGWRVIATIPASIFSLDRFAPGQRLRVAFSRYDATTGQPPVLSTTAAHRRIDFHRPTEWSAIVLASP